MSQLHVAVLLGGVRVLRAKPNPCQPVIHRLRVVLERRLVHQVAPRIRPDVVLQREEVRVLVAHAEADAKQLARRTTLHERGLKVALDHFAAQD